MNKSLSRSFSATVTAVLAFSVLFLLLLSPARSIESVKNGFLLFANSVLPSLFPFFFLTKLLTGTGICNRLSKWFSPLMRWYRCPPAGGYVFFMSILSGYPVGAKIASDLRQMGVLTPSDCRKILSFSSTSGPFFVVGTVGAAMLSDPVLGWIALAAHLVASLLAGWLFCRFSRPSEGPAELPQPVFSDSDRSLLSEAVSDSVLSILNVGGFIALCYVLLDLLTSAHLLFPAQHLFAFFFEKCGLDPALADALCYGIVEMTRGCSLVAATSASPAVQCVFCAFLISFGGLSIQAQALAYVRKCGVSAGCYLLQKIFHALLTVPVALLLCLIFLP